MFFHLNDRDLVELIPNFGMRKKFTIRLPPDHPLASSAFQKDNGQQVIESKKLCIE